MVNLLERESVGRPKGNGVNPNFLSICKYKEMLRKYIYETRKARRSFFSNIISKNMNNRVILTVGNLTKPPLHLRPELVSTEKCNEFASFFKGKIDQIRLSISSQTQITQYPEPPVTKRGALHLMAEFTLVDIKVLGKTIQSLSSSTCEFDILPTSFLKSVFTLFNSPHIDRFAQYFKTCNPDQDNPDNEILLFSVLDQGDPADSI